MVAAADDPATWAATGAGAPHGAPAPERRHRSGGTATGAGAPPPGRRHRSAATGAPPPERRHRSAATGAPPPERGRRHGGAGAPTHRPAAPAARNRGSELLAGWGPPLQPRP